MLERAKEIVENIVAPFICAHKGHDWGRKRPSFKPHPSQETIGGHQDCRRCNVVRVATLTREEYEEYREWASQFYCTCDNPQPEGE